MRTRCPACQTVFRVSAEQLRVREGKVRCGHCRHVFNAHNMLDSDDAVVPEVAAPFKGSGSIFVLEERPARDSGAETPARAITDASSGDVESKRDSAPPAEDKAEIRSKAEGEAKADAEAAAKSERGPQSAHAGGGIIPTALFIRKASAPEPKRVTAPQTLPTPMATPFSTRLSTKPPTRARSVPGKSSGQGDSDRTITSDLGRPESDTAPPVLEALAEAAAGPPRPVSADGKTDRKRPFQYTAEPPEAPTAPTAPIPSDDAPAVDAPTDGPISEEAEADAAAENVDSDAANAPFSDGVAETLPAPEAAEARALDALDRLPGESTGNSWRMSLAVGALIALLGAQTALIYRKALVQDAPALRPFFTTLCANIGCSMALPRDASQIRIEISDLNRLPEKDDAFVLSATLRNESVAAQAYPHLELTLTNAQDRAVARRVFTPQEWMPTEPSERGFASREEIELVVHFTADGLGASGYRLYVFNP